MSWILSCQIVSPLAEANHGGSSQRHDDHLGNEEQRLVCNRHQTDADGRHVALVINVQRIPILAPPSQCRHHHLSQLQLGTMRHRMSLAWCRPWWMNRAHSANSG